MAPAPSSNADSWFPEFPEKTLPISAADDGGAVDLDRPGWLRASLSPRHEDVTQDGRFVSTAIVPGLGVTLWAPLRRAMRGFDAFHAEGIVPILRRMIISTCPGPFSIYVPVTYEGTWRFAREIGGDRLFLNMYLEARAPIASTYGPAPDAMAEMSLVGRVFAEHVITRPFATAESRKVTKLEGPVVPQVFHPYAFETAEELVGAPTPSQHHATFTFGRMHTDSNQHVNSLVYPRIFEDIVAHALAPSEATSAASIAVEMRWRKPFFAGETADVAFSLERHHVGDAQRIVATGAFGPRGASSGRPSCGVRLLLG